MSFGIVGRCRKEVEIGTRIELGMTEDLFHILSKLVGG
jgi:hypothetical protein